MNENILVYPDDSDDLVAMYLPGGKASSQMQELRTLEAYIRNTLDDNNPRFAQLDALPHGEVCRKLEQMRKVIFHLSLHAFVCKVCRQQCEICEQNFWDAPNGEEAQWIADSVMPDIYEKGEYERLEAWWHSLSQERQLEIVRENAEQWQHLDDEQLLRKHRIDRFWQNSHVEHKEEIYQDDMKRQQETGEQKKQDPQGK